MAQTLKQLRRRLIASLTDIGYEVVHSDYYDATPDYPARWLFTLRDVTGKINVAEVIEYPDHEVTPTGNIEPSKGDNK